MKLADYLREQAIPSAQFAKRVGVLKQTMYKYVHHLCFPPAAVLVRIKEETGGHVTADDFAAAFATLRPSPTPAAGEAA